jgi:alpha-N-acetylglucosaminidase
MIDLMAMYGVNAPLSVTGLEGVWLKVGKRLGIPKEKMDQFFVGPGYLPFGWMGCLDGWAGPLPDSWIEEHVDLEKKILERERSMGMTPVLQGFTGHVPKSLEEVNPAIKLVELKWFNS